MSLSSACKKVWFSASTQQLMIAAAERGYTPKSRGLLFGVLV
jgi:hypothetical protein